jgi:hypothetical protein
MNVLTLNTNTTCIKVPLNVAGKGCRPCCSVLLKILFLLLKFLHPEIDCRDGRQGFRSDFS